MRSHQQFRETLTSGSMLSTTIRRIASKSNNLQTVTSTKISLNSSCFQVALPQLWPDIYHVRPQNIVSQIANNKHYNDDIAAALNLDPTDEVILEKWMLFSNIVNIQQHGCYNFCMGHQNFSPIPITLIGSNQKMMMNTLRIVLPLRTRVKVLHLHS